MYQVLTKDDAKINRKVVQRKCVQKHRVMIMAKFLSKNIQSSVLFPHYQGFLLFYEALRVSVTGLLV